jgi:BioD-like phosphotransacetylase family protein
VDGNTPISGELAALLPAMAQTMQGSVQALRMASALAAVLIAKGLVTQAELDAAMSVNGDLANNLRDVLMKFDKIPD